MTEKSANRVLFCGRVTSAQESTVISAIFKNNFFMSSAEVIVNNEK